LPKQRRKVLLAPGNRGEAEFAVATAAGVDPENGQPVAVELRPHGGRRMVIVRLQFDGCEPGRCRRAETLEERPIAEQECQIGG
jgi:hypothetical protein